MFDFIISEKAYEYLYVQRGEIASIQEIEPWLRAYNHSIDAIYQSIQLHLPVSIKSTLDIGSGLGGINAVINKHVGGNLNVHLLDGEADQPRVHRHNQTFNDMGVARDFLHDNGVTNLTTHSSTDLINVESFDLITSFASWCFHIHPSEYLNFVKSIVSYSSVLIIEVRKNPTFLSLLINEFGTPIVVAEGPKFQRCIFFAQNMEKFR